MSSLMVKPLYSRPGIAMSDPVSENFASPRAIT
jgi:hypothetical protein